MTDPRAPGWYADPSGAADRLRWWDGSGWTAIGRDLMPHEVARPRPDVSWSGGDLLDSGPAGRGGTRPGGDPARGGTGPAGDSLGSGEPPSRRTAWIAVLVAVGVIGALVLGGGFPGLRRSDAGAPTASRQGQSIPPLDEPTFDPPLLTPEPAPPVPVSGRIVDEDAGLSYDVLPGDWQAWDQFAFQGFTASVGYYRVLQQDVPSGGEYWANVTSGLVDTGRNDDLAGTASRLVGGLAAGYYPKHARRDLVRRATTVDGRPGYLTSYLAAFDQTAARGYLAKSERVAVLVVDTGRSRPSALYVSLPDTVRSTWTGLDGLLASVRISR